MQSTLAMIKATSLILYLIIILIVTASCEDINLSSLLSAAAARLAAAAGTRIRTDKLAQGFCFSAEDGSPTSGCREQAASKLDQDVLYSLSMNWPDKNLQHPRQDFWKILAVDTFKLGQVDLGMHYFVCHSHTTSPLWQAGSPAVCLAHARCTEAATTDKNLLPGSLQSARCQPKNSENWPCPVKRHGCRSLDQRRTVYWGASP